MLDSALRRDWLLNQGFSYDGNCSYDLLDIHGFPVFKLEASCLEVSEDVWLDMQRRTVFLIEQLGGTIK